MTVKIAIVSNTSWSVFNFRFNLAKRLNRDGYEVVVIAPFDEYSDKIQKEFKYYDVYMNNKGVNPNEDIKTMMDLYKLYKKVKPDVVLHYTIKPNIYGTIACSCLGIKTVNNISGLGTLFIKQNFITRIAKWLYKYSQSKANKIFFQNKDDYDFFVNENLVVKNRCDILPGSGVDTEIFKPIEYKKEDNIFRFLLIARMLRDKGVGEYVEAAKIIISKYKNVEFELLGPLGVANKTAISKKEMQKWVDEGLVNYLGVTDDVKEFIAKADCIILPSYREGTPRILLESASMDKPIITTNVPGCKEVVDDGVNGFLCEVKNVKDLADKMEMMLELSEDERKVMGEAGRVKMINEFDEGIVIGKYLKVLEKIL